MKTNYRIIALSVLCSIAAITLNAEDIYPEAYKQTEFVVDNVRYLWKGYFDKVKLTGIESSEGRRTITVPDSVTIRISVMGLPSNNGVKMKVNEIGSMAFDGVELDTLILPEGIKDLPPLTFGQKCHIRHLKLPRGLEVIHTEALKRVMGLDSLIIPEGVRVIKPEAMGTYGSSQARYIELPSTLTEIGDNAICNFPDLETLRIAAKTPPMATIQSFGHQSFCAFGNGHILAYGKLQPDVLEVPQGCAEAYRAHPAWGTVFPNIVEFTTASLPETGADDPAKRFEAKVEDGRIVVTAAKQIEISVAQPDGRVLFTGTVTGSRTLRVPRGVCVVSAQGQSTKLLVK